MIHQNQNLQDVIYFLSIYKQDVMEFCNEMYKKMQIRKKLHNNNNNNKIKKFNLSKEKRHKKNELKQENEKTWKKLEKPHLSRFVESPMLQVSSFDLHMSRGGEVPN